jgi:hypothetical protein
MAEMCPIRGWNCIERECRWWYELSDKHGSCSVTFGALMLHEILQLLQREKRQQAKIWEVDEKTGAALLGRAGWTRNHHGNWESPKGDVFCPMDQALYTLGLELKE